MSLKGGYQIINLKNREFSTTRNNMEYYKDIFFNLLNSHAKMIIVSGLNMDGVKYNDYETIFYEVEQPDDNPYFQCIARRIWNTKDYKCITKYINIYYDDRVMCTQEEFTYEILPDGEMSLTSTNALQNKVITKNFNDIRYVRTLPDYDAVFLDSMFNQINTSPIRYSQNGHCDSMGNAVINIKHIEGQGNIVFTSIRLDFDNNSNYTIGRYFEGIMILHSFSALTEEENVYRVMGSVGIDERGEYFIGAPSESDSYTITSEDNSPDDSGKSWITIMGKFYN